MSRPRRFTRAARAGLLVLLGVTLAASALDVSAQQSNVASTLHNLSSSGPGEVRSVTETEICKFCHIPHNAIERAPLWGHALSNAVYATPKMRRNEGVQVPAPQPDGSSRLCLSCHDGTVALGDIGGQSRAISMANTQRLRPGHTGYLGTDLSGSHPISFVVSDADHGGLDSDTDMGLKSLGAVGADGDVKLDRSGKMQCTTCHDPHSDRYYQKDRVPRFWVKPTVEEVCLTCHVLR